MFLYMAVQLPPKHLLKRLSIPCCIFFNPLLWINWPYVCELIVGLPILFHRSVCLILCQYHTVLITIVLKYSLKSGSTIPPLVLLSQDYFSYSGSIFGFHVSFRITYSVFILCICKVNLFILTIIINMYLFSLAGK